MGGWPFGPDPAIVGSRAIYKVVYVTQTTLYMFQCLRPPPPPLPMSMVSPHPPCGLGVGGQQFASANLILDLWSPLTPPVGCGYGDGTVPILFDGRTKPCITPCEPCPASECWICLHRGAPDTHQTVSDKPPDWFCFDFLKEYKESGGLAQPSLDRHSIGRGGGL